jgi:hypothetical protein
MRPECNEAEAISHKAKTLEAKAGFFGLEAEARSRP